MRADCKMSLNSVYKPLITCNIVLTQFRAAQSALTLIDPVPERANGFDCDQLALTH